MTTQNDNSPRDDSAGMLDENISRLLKTSSESTLPSRRFSESLIDGALLELSRKARGHPAAGSGRFEKTLGWAAMIAAACSAGAAVIATILLKMNFLFQAVVVSMMIFNWIAFLGEFIR